MFWKNDRSKLYLAASILSADFAHLADEVKHVTDAGIEQIHIEVGDGVFSPDITVGAHVVKSLRKVTDAILETHLMTVKPEDKIVEFAQAGADLITFHIEATDQAQSVIHKIKGAGSKAGVALNPGTPLCMIEELLYDVDVVLLMTAIPGAAGQPLLKHSLDKIKRLHNIIRENDYNCLLEVDGGVTIENAQILREAGANILVSGTAIYESTDVWASVAMLKGE
ncbi:MAG: ribulose-phosphate 3-epimerase [Selenomonadaceae bacterium]|nr:ribulose-phosphate 3-epimerase [Selenomonadaceae bacterium]